MDEERRGGGGFRSRPREFNKGGSGGGGFRRDFGPREMHKATCSECGQECEVPFKPAEGKPVFCKDCYRNRKSF
ncbi:DNA-directed RNA polymerase [Candidatus Woesearchaeota archaeon]|nr:MAG: DNA-directed RNA polymerase [Candidatus Woesearchaeota archaeon]